jgi:hypothetical protein
MDRMTECPLESINDELIRIFDAEYACLSHHFVTVFHRSKAHGT